MVTHNPASRILIVDDTFGNLLSVGALLEQFNLEFSLAQSGADAIKIIRTRIRERTPMFDIIYMDF